MIDITDVAAGILNGYSFQLHSRLQSWRGGMPLAEDIPAFGILEEDDATLRVPERLTFQVPVEDRGVSWVPTTYDHPLSWHGQRIVAQVGVSVGNGAIEWMDRGTFLINSAETDSGAVSLECLGLLQLLDEAELKTEYQPKASATLSTVLRAMIEPGITVDLDDAPSDRTIPTGITWSDNRLDNVYNVIDAWPARMQINEAGSLEVLDPLEDPDISDVVFTFTDGAGGTVVEFNASGSREGAFNGVVAKGQYPDTAGAKAGQEIVATVYDTDASSPFRYGGEFSPYLVPYGYASPLLTTLAQVQSAANTRMRTLRRQASRAVRITAVPHPALKCNDAVAVTSDRLGLAAELGRIEAMSLPHQAEGGAMGLTVRIAG
jgi:hypothetical protein